MLVWSGLVWFLCLIVYQPSWVILCQSCLWRRTGLEGFGCSLLSQLDRKWMLFDICRSLPLSRTWHKVNDYSADLGEGKVGHEPRLEPCWSMLVIDTPSAMWSWWALLYLDPNLGPGTYACLKLKLDSKVQGYTRGTKVSMFQLAHPKVNVKMLYYYYDAVQHVNHLATGLLLYFDNSSSWSTQFYCIYSYIYIYVPLQLALLQKL